MRTRSQLPPGLDPWGPSLAVLAPDVALAVGHLVRRLDPLVRRGESADVAGASPQGFAGLTNRGTPERMLLSEWLLADELPDEFLRRAGAGELLYLQRAEPAPLPEGRVVVLADVGPDQLGAGRLVSLAALVILHRRALARGSQLALGLLGEPPGTLHDGELPELLAAWSRARSADLPEPAQVADWASGLDSPDELWVLAGPPLAAALGKRRHVLAARESEWGPAGATAVEVRCEGAAVTLALPPGPAAVHALRGRSLLRRASGPQAQPSGPHAMSCPSFNGADRRLLLRGETLSELVAVNIATNPQGGPGRVRHHRFPAPIVAAASIGRRTVAVLRYDDELRVAVVGKRLASVEELVVPLDPSDPDLGDEAIAGELAPLFFDGGTLVCRFGAVWWRLTDVGLLSDRRLAMAPGHALDTPRTITYAGSGLRDSTGLLGPPLALPAQPDEIVLHRNALAVLSAGAWQIRGREVSDGGERVRLDPDTDVLGLLAHDPADLRLVTRSRGGMILRLVGRRSTKTLTRWSGITRGCSVHQMHPLMAVQHDSGDVEIVDLQREETIMRVPGAQ